LGSSIQLRADGGVSYLWLPNDGSLNNPNINNPIATPKENTTYVVIAFDSIGCKNIDTVHIEVDAPDDVFIPSAFTPNGDGLNDIFRMARSSNYTLVEMNVYDRWGKQVCHMTANDRLGWDGTVNGMPEAMGTYYYLFVVTDQYGAEKVLKGDVTLIR
jgi:gliding motility-associated-like protein